MIAQTHSCGGDDLFCNNFQRVNHRDVTQAFGNGQSSVPILPEQGAGILKNRIMINIISKQQYVGLSM